VRLEIKPGGDDRAQNADDGGEKLRPQKVGVKQLGVPEDVGNEGQIGKHQRLVNECHLGARDGDDHRREYDGPGCREGRAPRNGEKKANTKANTAARNSTAAVQRATSGERGLVKNSTQVAPICATTKAIKMAFIARLLALSRQAFS